MKEKIKKCSTCKNIYPLTDEFFSKYRFNADGYMGRCKTCVRKYHIEYRKKNKERLRKKSAEYRKQNKEKIRQRKKEYRENNKEKIKLRKQKYSRRSREKKNLREKRRRDSDTGYKILCFMRARINKAVRFQGAKKVDATINLVGCSTRDLKIYLESKFLEGMSWDNYGKGDGKWHIDHIKPCAAFDLTDQEQQKECFHYTNLQPLWESENLSKNSFYGGKLIRRED